MRNGDVHGAHGYFSTEMKACYTAAPRRPASPNALAVCLPEPGEHLGTCSLQEHALCRAHRRSDNLRLLHTCLHRLPPSPAHSCQRRVCRCTARGACPGTIAGAGLTFSLNTVRSSLIYGDDR